MLLVAAPARNVLPSPCAETGRAVTQSAAIAVAVMARRVNRWKQSRREAGKVGSIDCMMACLWGDSVGKGGHCNGLVSTLPINDDSF